MAAVIERAELHKTIWRIANELLRLFGDVYECLMTVYSSSIGKLGGVCASLEVSDRLAPVALDGRSDVARAYDAFRADWIQIRSSYGLAV
ncbi:hsdM: type I restriction-modification system, M subunit [uncultured Actinomyces sp.]|nr:hsdM: type I restriction-modification system, M subunit [uncultured Actinomyces sp.]